MDATNRWFPAWSDGLQLEIPGTEEIHHLAVVTWLKWRLPLDLTEIKALKAVVGTIVVEMTEMEEMEEIPEIALVTEMAMVVAPTSMKTLVVVETMRVPGLHLTLLLMKINSQSLA